MREFKPAHSNEELRGLIAGGLDVAGEVTLKTELFNGIQLALLVKEFDCDFSFSSDYSLVTLCLNSASASAEAV